MKSPCVGKSVRIVLLAVLLATSIASSSRTQAADHAAPPQVVQADGDSHWWDGFYLNDLNGRVDTLVMDSAGNLYAEGGFTSAGDVVANGLARWDGTRWHALEGWLDGPILTMLVDDDDDLYIGGYYQVVGGTYTAGIVRWDGNNWQPVGGAMNGRAFALAMDDAGNLYAAGEFTTVGGVSASGIAMWDGNAWHDLGGGMHGNWMTVDALVVDDAGNLYAGGEFEDAGGIAGTENIARWDGETWNPVGAGADGPVDALAIDGAGKLYAGGRFDNYSKCVMQWDGDTWSFLGDGLETGIGTGVTLGVYVLAVDDLGNVYAGGGFLGAEGVAGTQYIARWDGNAWHTMDGGVGSYVNAFVVDDEQNLYAGGYFSSAGGEDANYIAQWDGTKWNPVGIVGGQGLDYAVSALAADKAGNIYTNRDLAHWDGSQWNSLGARVEGGSVSALAFDRLDNLYVGGDFDTAGETSVHKVARWDGKQWDSLGGGVQCANDSYDSCYVNTLVTDDLGDLFVSGDFDSVGSLPGTQSLARWDGQAWHSLGGGVTDSEDFLSIGALVPDNSGGVYVGGNFDMAGGTPVSHVAYWDGEAWHALGTGVDGSVSTLALDDSGNLYVGGYFKTAGGISAANIARWDGHAWHSLGGTASSCSSSVCASPGRVTVLAADQAGGVYAGGEFDMAGGVSAHNIARWDGNTWQSLGSGLYYDGSESGIPYALAFDDSGNLYVVGRFAAAGGKASSFIAKWMPTLPGVEKTASHSTVTHGDTISYTLTGYGTGANLSLIDHLPVGLSAPTNLQASSGTPSYDAPSHQVRWTGAPAEGEQLTLTYQVTVTAETGPLALINAADLSNPSGLLSSDTWTVLLDPLQVFLPLIAR